MIFGPEGIVAGFIVEGPEFVFRVMTVGVQPLHAADGADLVFQSAVLVHVVRGVGESGAPYADVHH